MTKAGRITPTMAKQLAEQIRAVGKTAKSEEDVRLNVELALRHHLTQLGIQTQPSYEQPVTTLKGSGSTDAVYGFGIIEYKRPGIIGTPRGRKELVEQLSGYLVGKAREEAPTRPHEAVKKMIGIGLLNAQDAKERRGYDEDWLKDRYPLACAYLLKFEKLLRQRSGFRKYFCKEVGKGAKKRLEPFAPFYSLYNIGEYTLAPFKVCWREQAEFFTASVAGNSNVAGKSKVIIPDHKLMFVPLDNETEAHFVCAALNSAPSVLVVKSYGIETQTSTHVLEHVGLPKFNSKDNLHQHLAQLSRDAHSEAAKSEPDGIRLETIEGKIDEAIAKLWSITPAELVDIKFSLADLR